MIITGCAINQPTLSSNPNLPTVKNFKAYPDRNAVALRWNIIKDKNIKGYYIKRYDFHDKKWELIAKIDNRFKSIYVDTNLNPSTTYLYKIASFNSKNEPSLATKTATKTLPPIIPVIPLEIKPLKKGTIKIIFRPHPNERVKGYIIQRQDKVKWVDIANLTPRYNVEYIDTNLLDGHYYKYRIIAYTFDGIKSKPSKIMDVLTYKKPPLINDIVASDNLPKIIKLSWKKVKGVYYYKVYEKGLLGYNLIAKTKNNYYIDKVGKDNYSKTYKITAVSIYETESDLKLSKPVIGKTLNPPLKPEVAVNHLRNGIEFIIKSPDNRAKVFKIEKSENRLFAKQEIFFSKGNFIDTNINPKKSYIYKIYVIDKYNLISKPTIIEIGQ